MGNYYSPVTGMHYNSKEEKDSMERKYMADLQNKQISIAQQKIEQDRANAQEMNRINQEQMELQREQEERRIYEERENARRIEEATLQAEKDRYEHEMEMEELRQEHDKEMRYMKLCDDLGVNYEDIKILNSWANNLTIKQINEYKKIVEEIINFKETNEIKSLKNEIDEIENKIKTESKNIKRQLDSKVKELSRNDSKSITVKGVKRNGIELKETKEEIIKCIDENSSIISSCKSSLIAITIVAIMLFAITISFSEVIAIISLVGGFILDFAILDRLVRMKNGKKLMQESINNINSENEKLKKEISNLKKEEKQKIEPLKEEKKIKEEECSKLLRDREEELKNNDKYQNLLPKYDEVNMALSGEYKPNKEEFYNFRTTHYNKEMEMLLRKLNFDFGIIPNNEIKGNGTVDDYIQYIDKILIENNQNIKDTSEYNFDDSIEDDDYDVDPKLEEAIDLVIENGNATTSFISRKLNVGYARAR